MADVHLRPVNYFAAHYTVIPGETAKVFGSGIAISAPSGAGGSKGANTSVSNSAAVGVSELAELRLVCSQHPTHKPPPYTRQERESGPRKEVRKFTFCFRHRCGLESSDAFAQICLDAVFPQLKLWLALSDKAAKDGAQFHLQTVREAWVEAEESRSMSASPLTTPLEATPLTPRSNFQQRRMRRLLGVDDDDDDDLMASLNRVSETQIHAFVVLDALVAPQVSLRLAHECKLSQRQALSGSGVVVAASCTVPVQAAGERQQKRASATPRDRASPRKHEGNPLSALTQAQYLWNTWELNLLLQQLADFARIASCFTRKGTRRKSGDEPTIMLDIDEDRIFVQLLHAESTGDVPRLVSVTFSIDTINTCCKLRDNRYVQSPSIVKVQHDFHVSVWKDTRFPTVVPLTGAAAETLQARAEHSEPHTSLREERSSPEALTGSKTTMFLIGLLILRYAMREDYDIRSVRLTPGNMKPPFLVDDNGHARHDATIRALMLQLADGDDVNRPGPVQVLEALARCVNSANPGSSGGGASSSRSTMSSSMQDTAATPRGPRRPDPTPHRGGGGASTTSRRHRPLPTLVPCTSTESKSATVSSGIPLTATSTGSKGKSRLGVTSMYGYMDEKTIADIIVTAERQSRRKLPGIPSAKESNGLTEHSAVLRALEETEFERAQRAKIRKQLALSNILPETLQPEQHRIPIRANSWIVGEDVDHPDEGAAAGESGTTPVSAGLPPLYHSPLRPMTRAKGQSPRHHNAAVSGAHQFGDAAAPPPGSGDSTQRKTAETPANDVVPFSRLPRRSGPPDAVSRVFEL